MRVGACVMSEVKLYLGDCLDILPTLEAGIDAVITDPVWPNCPPDLLSGSDDPGKLLHDALKLCDFKRLVIVLRYDSDPRFLINVSGGLPFFRVQTLEYSVPGYNGRKLGGLEIAYCFGEPVPSISGKRVIPGRGPVVQPTPKNGHPAPRSIKHFSWLLNWWSEPGDTILDPFMGSGTTGVACVQTGRNFIGIEIKPEYYAIAEKRIKEAQMQLRMDL